jgi:predicted nucleotidyltransferase
MNSKPSQTTLEPIRRFIETIDREYPVRFAYLFGSRARGEATADSDADIAVCLAKRYEKSETAFIRGALIERAQEYLSCAADLVFLEEADLYLKYLIVKEGIPVKDNGDGSRAEFESRTLREYFDFQYYSDIYNHAMIESIKRQTYFGDGHGR